MSYRRCGWCCSTRSGPSATTTRFGSGSRPLLVTKRSVFQRRNAGSATTPCWNTSPTPTLTWVDRLERSDVIVQIRQAMTNISSRCCELLHLLFCEIEYSYQRSPISSSVRSAASAPSGRAASTNCEGFFVSSCIYPRAVDPRD